MNNLSSELLHACSEGRDRCTGATFATFWLDGGAGGFEEEVELALELGVTGFQGSELTSERCDAGGCGCEVLLECCEIR